MSAARKWVRNRRGLVKSVVATAVPVLAAGGWTPLSDDEVAAHEGQLAQGRDERRAALEPRPAPSPPAPAEDLPPAVAAPEPAVAPTKSGAKRPATTPDVTEES